MKKPNESFFLPRENLFQPQFTLSLIKILIRLQKNVKIVAIRPCCGIFFKSYDHNALSELNKNTKLKYGYRDA